MTTNIIKNKETCLSFDILKCPEVEARLDHWIERVDAIMEKMGLEAAQLKQEYGCENISVTVLTSIFNSTKIQRIFDETTGEVEINMFINPLELIDLEKIPRKFCITDLADPRLDEDSFLAEFISWLSGYLKIEDLSFENLSSQERKEIKCFLRLTRDPEMFDRAMEAGLSHELSHLFHKHLLNMPFTLSNDSLKKILGLTVVLGMANACFSRKNQNFLRGVFQTLLGIGGAMLVSTCLTLRAWKISRKQEFEADEKACTTLQDCSGLAYYFDTKDKHQDMEMKKWSANFKGYEFVRKVGAIILPFLLNYPPTHPRPKSRVENLQKLLDARAFGS